jgi:hypothetical protein
VGSPAQQDACAEEGGVLSDNKPTTNVKSVSTIHVMVKHVVVTQKNYISSRHPSASSLRRLPSFEILRD